MEAVAQLSTQDKTASPMTDLIERVGEAQEEYARKNGVPSSDELNLVAITTVLREMKLQHLAKPVTQAGGVVLYNEGVSAHPPNHFVFLFETCATRLTTFRVLTFWWRVASRALAVPSCRRLNGKLNDTNKEPPSNA